MPQRLTTSVIIPVYNESAYIDSVLQALQKQTRLPDEIIVVDNNSTDDTVKKAKQFRDVTVMAEKQQGNVFARNTGFASARGDIIFKLDADSLPEPDWLKVYVAALEQANAHAISGYVRVYDGSFRVIVALFTNFFIFRANKVLLRSNNMFGSNYALTKEAWQNIESSVHSRNDIWEDLDVAVQLRKHKMSVATIRQKYLAVSIRSSYIGIKAAWSVLMQWRRTFIVNNMSFVGFAVLLPICVVTVLHILGRGLAHYGFTPRRNERH